MPATAIREFARSNPNVGLRRVGERYGISPDFLHELETDEPGDWIAGKAGIFNAGVLLFATDSGESNLYPAKAYHQRNARKRAVA